MGNGWIKLHRKLLENPIFKNERYLKLWVYILLRANHKPDKIMWNGGILDIKAGQFVTGRDAISDELNIPASTVERILKYLENEHQIGQQKTSKFRVISILNWKQYQDMDSKTDNKRTTNGQQTDTNKNDKNVKNDKNTPTKVGDTDYTADFLTLWERYPRKVGKGAAFSAWRRAKRPLPEKMFAAIEQQLLSDQWQRDDGQYIPHLATWINQRRWEDEVEAKESSQSYKKY